MHGGAWQAALSAPTSSLAECDLQFGRYEGLVRSLVPNKDNHAMAAATQMVRGQPC